MRTSKLLPLVLIAFGLAACRVDTPPEDEPFVDPGLTPPPATEMEAETIDMNLDEIAGSGVTGDVEIRTVAGQQQIVARVENAGPNVTLNGGVYRGTCDALGERVTELQPITTNMEGEGQATSSVTIPGFAHGTAAQPGSTYDPATQPGTTTAAQQQLVIAYTRPDQPQMAVTCAELDRDRRF